MDNFCKKLFSWQLAVFCTLLIVGCSGPEEIPLPVIHDPPPEGPPYTDPIGHIPSANDQWIGTHLQTSVGITLFGSDVENQALSYSVTSNPAHGTLSEQSGANVTYVPAAGFVGQDSFTFRVNDGHSDSLDGTVNIIVTSPCTPAQENAVPYSGSGTEGDPFLICSATQMVAIGHEDQRLLEHWRKSFRLMNNISLAAYTGTQFNIIGTFGGTFDGNGFVISNFSYTDPTKEGVGLFGSIYWYATVKNLRMSNVQVKGSLLVGSLAGASAGLIQNVYVEGRVAGSIFANKYYVGGLVGLNTGTITNAQAFTAVVGRQKVGGLVGENTPTGEPGIISNSFAAGSVTGYIYVGGLVGFNQGTVTQSHAIATVDTDSVGGGLVGKSTGDITRSFATGGVTSVAYAGGLVGINQKTISYCYATGDVFGSETVGGLVGYQDDLSAYPISYSYAKGRVTGTTGVGGLIGVAAPKVRDDAALDSFWNIETSEQSTSAGGTPVGKTTTEMQSVSTYSSWDSNIWLIQTQAYPTLK